MELLVEIKDLHENPQYLGRMAELYHAQLMSLWDEGSSLQKAKARLLAHFNHGLLPITQVAVINNTPVGMVSLRITDGIRMDLSPWLGGLVVDPNFQNQGIGKFLIESVKREARSRGFKKLHLLTFDKNLPGWYVSLGWEIQTIDELMGRPVTVMAISL